MRYDERLDEIRERRRWFKRRAMLEEEVHDLIEIIEYLLTTPDNQESIMVQVAITDQQKVLLHASETNAAGNPINRDSATAGWTVDRPDLITLELSADGWDAEAISVGPDGDAVVTVTVTEPGVDDGVGGTTPGATYVGTQGITVSADGTVAGVEITADAPEQR